MTYEQTLLDLATRREDIVVMTAENRAAIRNLPEALGDRFIDVGICEQTMVGAAAGLALRGRRPILHALATFLTLRAYEFVRTDIGIAGLPVVLVGGVPGFLSEANGPTHQAVEDVAVMRLIPGMQVVCPSDADELSAAMPAIIDSGRPTYVRHNPTPSIVDHHHPWRLGVAETFGGGTDVAILVYGFLLGEALAARDILEEQGITARVINLRSLVPLDTEAVLNTVADCPLIVTLEDHFKVGGLYSILAELLTAHRLAATVLPLALENRWFRAGLLRDLMRAEEFTADQIALKIAGRYERLAAKEPSSHVPA